MKHTPRSILLFWAPLAAQWLMMASEGPFLAAIIARLGDPAFNLAAYGVTFAVAILVESPVIMLMSASTALVEDEDSYRKLRAFTNALNAGSTGLLLLVLIPPVFDVLTGTLLGLPEGVSRLVYGSLWLLLPWPAAIGYRRFLHGLLIRSGRTRLVAYGTLLRLFAMASTALLLYRLAELPGALVGAAALSAGVSTEALAARFMAAGAVRELTGSGAGGAAELARAEPEGGAETGVGAEAVAGAEDVAAAASVASAASPSGELTYGGIARFYYPLALTSFIGLTVQPLLTFFMGRAPAPIESLAVFPVVHALSFLFRALGLSYQEAAIALLGKRCEHARELGRFGLWLGLASSVGMGLVVFTPLAEVWFRDVSGLTPELTAAALVPARILAFLPALSVLLSWQRAVLVQGRDTRPITWATVLEVAGIAALFPLFGWGLGMTGVTAAVLAFLCGRAAGNLFLLRPVRGVLAR
ncbi:MAG TPA: hypothetical protein VMK65_06480 [Longimicrobiales bacterium]|nr:hypothetical protein [Longimicrobiales bacterium]